MKSKEFCQIMGVVAEEVLDHCRRDSLVRAAAHHYGPRLLDILSKDVGSKARLADRLGVSQQHLYKIMSGHTQCGLPVFEKALRLGLKRHIIRIEFE